MSYFFCKNTGHHHPVLPALSLGFCVFLSACSTTSETFDCKEGKGVGCKSISQVNSMVDQGILANGLSSDVEKGKQSILPLSTSSMATDFSIVEGDKILRDPLSQHAEIPLSDTMMVHRAREEHLRVWIAPFQDEHGNLHEASVIHTVLKPGYWHLNPSPQQVSEEQSALSKPLTGKEAL